MIFSLALFLSAALTFTLQPLFARMVTPLLGGSPAVWNTAMVFFQAALLVGYGYAHALQRLRSVRAQLVVHAVVMGVAAFALPIAPTPWMGAPDVLHPARWLLAVLALSVGAPYAAASATSPLLQAWYARSGRPDAHDPYFLYGASNVGSLVGLLAYPAIVEPLSGLRTQSVGWSIAYGVTALAVLLCGVVVVRTRGTAQTLYVGHDPRPDRLSAEPSSAPTAGTAGDDAHTHSTSSSIAWRTRLYWTAAAAVPSALLIAVTQHLVTDIASAPFLWVPPLAVYLVTFIVTFRRGANPPGRTLLALHAGMITILAILPSSGALWVDGGLQLTALLVAGLVCHGALAASRPSASHLTLFYNHVSLGGVIGGALTALVAPVLSDRIVEYPIALAATLLFRAAHEVEWPNLSNTLLTLSIPLVALMGSGVLPVEKVFIGTVGLALFFNRGRRWAMAPMVVATMFVLEQQSAFHAPLLRERTFFGTYRVVDVDGQTGTMRMLLHGTTAHGAQWLDSARARTPLTYYAQGSAVHEGVQAALPVDRPARAAFIGLGTGAMACVLRDGDSALFIDIDRAVQRIAEDTRYFRYLEACPRHTTIRIADGRLALQAMPAESFDVILADAFSSDAIPTHLLTREAVRIYMRALRPDGALVVHVSNRNLAIRDEAWRVAQAESLAVRYWSSPTRRTPSGLSLEATSTDAVIITKTDVAMRRLSLPAHWRNAPDTLRGAAWSDDAVNVLRPAVAMWRYKRAAKTDAASARSDSASQRSDAGNRNTPSVTTTDAPPTRTDSIASRER